VKAGVAWEAAVRAVVWHGRRISDARRRYGPEPAEASLKLFETDPAG
jgi:hypothetical protein